MIKLVLYISQTGECPYEEWADSLDATTAARITAAIDRMRAGNLGDHKGVGEGVTERRIDFGPGYRVYFGRDGETVVVLLGGGTKKRQQKDIEAAKLRWKDYKARKRKGLQ